MSTYLVDGRAQTDPTPRVTSVFKTNTFVWRRRQGGGRRREGGGRR